MRHFDFLGEEQSARLFDRLPENFSADGDRALLAAALGATLYIPGSRPELARDIARQRAAGALSIVVCLEDAVSDQVVAAAERNVIDQLRRYARTRADGPLLFVRVRSAEQLRLLVEGLGEDVPVLAGFVLPKFAAEHGNVLLDVMVAAAEVTGCRFLAMPVLETPEVIHAEYRTEALLEVRRLLEKHREHVLAVRIGATDLSGVYGLRRHRELTVYDVRVVADAIATIVNVFGRADGSGFPVTGPVWEYFPTSERIFKPQLRESPFSEHADRRLRTELLAGDLDGLIREFTLDRANGLTGKTVIHPTHVAAVHALSVVTQEEHRDAVDILGTVGSGGASASVYRNKMNESKPHGAWARQVLLRARAFGVARSTTSFVDLLGAGLHA